MLTAEQRAFYEKNGYVLVPNQFSEAELAEMRTEVDGMMVRADNGGKNLNATWGGNYLSDEDRKKLTVASIHNVQYQSAAFAKLLVDDRLTEVVADIVGPNVQLHHTKMHAKPPEKGAPFPMHQDHPYFQHEKHTMMAAILHLDDSTEENGCLCVVPGSFKKGPLQHTDKNYLPVEQYPLSDATPCPAKAGDILLFSYLTIHGSGVNKSDRMRRIVLIQFRSPEDRPLGEQHQSPGQGMMVRGHNPNFYKPVF